MSQSLRRDTITKSGIKGIFQTHLELLKLQKLIKIINKTIWIFITNLKDFKILKAWTDSHLKKIKKLTQKRKNIQKI